MRYSKIIAILAGAGMMLCAGVVDGAWFMPLPQLPGSSQAGDALAISADGSTVVGTSHDGFTFQAVKWSSAGVIEQLGTGNMSSAWGASADGSTIVGYGFPTGGFPIAVRWTQATGAVSLGDLPGREVASRAYAVSADGSVVVGVGSSTQTVEAFRWTAATGFVSISDSPGGTAASEGRATSAAGSVIVGSGLLGRGTEAFRWTAETGMLGLGDLPGGGFFSEAYGISANGSVVVGRATSDAPAFPFRAFRWTEQQGMVALPDIPGVGAAEIAYGISGDGNVIVGAAIQGSNAVAFAWDSFHGTRSIADILVAQGVELDGFRLGRASAVSFDGRTIVGIGTPRGSFRSQPWIARFDAGTFVPEPTGFILAVVCAALIGMFAMYRAFLWRGRNAS